MAKKSRAEGAPEYRDTFRFPFFPEYTFTPGQKCRFRFFQGRIEHFRKIIDYADSFDDPNRINLVFIIGYDPAVMPYILEHTEHNTVALCARVPDGFRKAYDEYHQMLRSLKKLNYVTPTGELKRSFYDYLRKAQGDTADRWRRIMRRYRMICNSYKKYYKIYVLCDKLYPEKTVSIRGLNRIARKHFPMGREAMGCGDAVYRTDKMGDTMREGLLRHQPHELLGFDEDVNLYERFRPSIERCNLYIRSSIANNKFANLAHIADKMKEPPYGWGNDLHSAYCFGYALSPYLENGRMHDLGTLYNLSLDKAHLFAMLLSSEPYAKSVTDKHYFRMFPEEGWSLSNRLSIIFSVFPHLPLDKMIRDVCAAIEIHTRYPVAILDEQLRELICHFSRYTGKDSQALAQMTEYFSWDKCLELHERYAGINETVLETVRQKYPDAGITADELKTLCTVKESGWLWPADRFWKEVDKLANNTWETPERADFVRQYRRILAERRGTDA